MPKTLDETYQRTLREIKEANWEFAHRLFQLLSVASRPLLVQELSELLAFDFDVKPIPKFHEDWRLEDPVDAVLSTCSSLLAIIDVGDPSITIIQFSHYSVKEFLTSSRLAEASDTISRRYHVSMTPAHTLAAQVCLGILLHLDGDVVTYDGLKKWPLVKYAAAHWAGHALFEGVSQEVERGVEQLFDPREPHFSVCVSIRVLRQALARPAERLLPHLGTPLHCAALWDLHFIVTFLIIERSQDVHSRGFTDDATPLHLASSLGHMKVIRMLVEHGADVTAQTKNGDTPLHLAMTSPRQLEEGNVEVARMLIERGAGVAAQNKNGETPIHLASQYGQVQAVRILIERGADVAAQNKDGLTPLHLASRNGKAEIARILIDSGAEVAAQNKVGATPLHLASCSGEVEISCMLIERGAEMAAQNEDGLTPLHLASKYGRVGVARTLIERGADVAAQNKDEATPLHLASREGQVEVARVLIEHGADVTAKNKYGETPLHRTSRPDSYPFEIEELTEVSRILLEHGADVNAKNKAGLTPLRLVSQSRYAGDIRAQVLLQHGADPDDGTGEDFSLGIFDSDSDSD